LPVGVASGRCRTTSTLRASRSSSALSKIFAADVVSEVTGGRAKLPRQSIARDEPADGVVSQSGPAEEPVDGTGVPHCQCSVVLAMGVQDQAELGRELVDQTERAANATWAAAGPTGVHRDDRLRDRIVGLVVACREASAAAHDRPAPFQLVVGQVDATPGRLMESTFDAILGHQYSEVFQLAASDEQEAAVRALAVAKDGPFDRRQEEGLAMLEPLLRHGSRLFQPDRASQEGRAVMCQPYRLPNIVECVAEVP
jgi:hypothetical protein